MMEELLTIAEDHPDSVVKSVTEWVFHRNVELGMASPEEVREYVGSVFTLIALPEPRGRTIPEWDRIRVILALSAMALFPSAVPSISLQTNYGPLFVLLLVLHSMTNEHTEMAKQCQEAFRKALAPFSVKTFYSIPPCYYFQVLPTFLKKYLNANDFMEHLGNFFSAIPKLDPQNLNVNFIIFSNEMFRLAWRHVINMINMRSVSVPDCLNQFCEAYLGILKLCTSCPSIVLLNFLHPWAAFLRTSADPVMRTSKVADQTEVLTKYCDTVARGKHHELHRTFPWQAEIRFFMYVPTQEQKYRVLALFCHAFRSVLRLEVLPGVSDATKEVIQHIKSQRTANSESWEISYVLASCESTLSMGISDLKRVSGVIIDPSISEKTKRKEWVSFADQCLDGDVNARTDYVLGTLMEGTAYPTLEAGADAFEAQIALLNQCRTRLMTVMTFQFVFVECALEDLKGGSKGLASVGLHYVSALVRLHLKIMIYASHRIAMLQRFNNAETIAKRGRPSCTTKNQTLRRVPEFGMIFQRYVEHIQRIPSKFYPVFAREMAGMILKAKSKGLITLNFVKAMTLMHANSPIPIEKSLFGRIMSELMQISAMRLKEVMDHAADRVRGLYEWVLLVIRIALKNGRQYCEPSLLVFLRNYYRLVFSTVIGNVKKISLHSFALKILDAITQTMSENTLDQKEAQEYLKPLQKLKGSTFEDIQTNAKWSSLSTLIQVVSSDNDSHSISAVLSLAEMAFQTHDPDLIKKASTTLLALLSQEKSIVLDSTRIYTLFRAWFSALRYAGRDVAVSLTRDISTFVPAFAHPQWISQSPLPTLIYKPLDLDLSPIINEIGVQVGDSDDEAANLFVFVTWAFEALKSNVDKSVNELRIPQYQVLSLLLLCANYTCLEAKVTAFCDTLVKFYGNLYLTTGSDLFILNVLAVAGKYRSENTRYAVNLAVSFLKYVKERGVRPELIARTIDESLGFFNTSHRLFSTTGALSLFVRFFPECVSIDHIRTVLVSSNGFSGFDREFTKVLNRLLKEYLAVKSFDEKKEFVNAMYQLLSTSLLTCRLVILKRMEKLGIPVPVRSFEELEVGEPSLTFQRLALAISCGTEVPLVFDDAHVAKVRELASMKIDHFILEKLSRKVMFYLPVMKCKELFRHLLQDPVVISNLLNFLCNTLSARYPSMRKYGRRVFAILLERYPENEQITKQIDEYCNNSAKIFVFFSQQHERIAFFRRLTKLLPNRVPEALIKDFMDAIFEYSEFPEPRKFECLTNLVHFLKYLTIEKYVGRPGVRAYVSSPHTTDSTYLQSFIATILKLYEHPEIPFRTITGKYVLRFLRIFAAEAVEFLCALPPRTSSPVTFSLLQDLVCNDEQKVFYRSFLRYFYTESFDHTTCHPEVFAILQVLARKRELVEDGKLRRVLDDLFGRCIKTEKSGDFAAKGTRLHEALMKIGLAIVDTLKDEKDPRRILAVCSVFNLTGMLTTHLYRSFVNVVFKKSSQENVTNLLMFVLSPESRGTLTERMTRIILKHAIKSLQVIPPALFEDIWRSLEDKIRESEKIGQKIAHSTVLVTTRQMLPKLPELPSKERVAKIMCVLKLSISLPATNVVVYALKLACLLVEMNLMSDKLYFQITRQMFSYAKFFELPYSEYVFKFLNLRPDLFDHMPSDLRETIAFSLHTIFLSMRKMRRFLDIFTRLPHLLQALPMSLITTLSWHLGSRLAQTEELSTEQNLVELDSLFNAGLRLCVQAKPSALEIERFMKECFTFMRLILNAQLTVREFPETFVHYLIKSNCPYFDISILSDVMKMKGPFNNYAFGLVCAATKTVGTRVVLEYPDSIVHAINFICTSDYKNSFSILLFKDLIEFIAGHAEVAPKYQQRILSATSVIMSDFSEQGREKLMICIKGIVTGAVVSDHLKLLDDMWRYIDATPKSTAGRTSIMYLAEFAILALEELSRSIQGAYFASLFERVKSNEIYTECYLMTFRQLIGSKKISLDTKRRLIDTLPELASRLKCHLVGTVLDGIVHFEKISGLDTRIIQIHILLILYGVAPVVSRKAYLLRAMALLPPNSFEFLVEQLPVRFWNNDNLCGTVALLMRPDGLWESVVSFGPVLSKVSSVLAEAALRKHLTKDTEAMFNEFLVMILAQGPTYQYTEVISAILSIFHESQYVLNTKSAQKAIKRTGRTELLEHFIARSAPEPYLLLPHAGNDMIFGRMMKDISSQEATATALTFLSQYAAANTVYATICSETSEFFNQMATVNTQFYLPQQEDLDLDSIIRPLLRPDKTSRGVDAIKGAVTALIKGDEQGTLTQVREAAKWCLTTICRKANLSIFDREQVAAVELAMQVIRKGALHSKMPPVTESLYSRALNPSVIMSLLKLEQKLGDDQHSSYPSIAANEESVIIMSPSTCLDFKQVSAVTTRGLWALGTQQIEEFMHGMSAKISQGRVTSSDWSKFAPFSFNLLLIQPSSDAFSAALSVYAQVVASSALSTSLMKQEATARILTLVRMAMALEDRNMIESVIGTSGLFHRSQADSWKFWLHHLVLLSRSHWFNSLIMELLQELQPRSGIYAKELQQHDLFHKLTMNTETDRSHSNVVHPLEDVFDTVFSLNFTEISQVLSQRSPPGFNIQEYRKKLTIPTSIREKAIMSLTPNEISTADRANQNELKKLEDSIALLSQHVPCSFPVKIDNSQQLTIFKFDTDWRVLSPEMLLFYAMTSPRPHQALLVQKSTSRDGFVPRVLTYQNTSVMFKQVLHNCYTTRTRALQLAAPAAFEVGTRYIVVPIDNDMLSLESIFEQVTMTHPKEWLESRTELSTDVLLKLGAGHMTKQGFQLSRIHLLRSFACASVTSLLFNIPYPSMDRVLFSFRSGSIPVLYGLSEFSVESETRFRLSPNFASLFGDNHRGQLVTLLAAVAHALVEKLEVVRSHVEVKVFDESKGNLSCDDLFAGRNAFERRLFELAPPSGPAVSPDDCGEWFSRLTELIDQSSNPEGHDPMTIPWF